MIQHLIQSLDNFIGKYQEFAHKEQGGLYIEHDIEWPSECYVQPLTFSHPEFSQLVSWQPHKRQDAADFSGIEAGLEMNLHSDIKAFYGRYWSDNLCAISPKGNLQLLQPWNPQDFERLQQNLVGHVLMKRRLKHPETLFFGITDQDDFILTVENHSGRVMLERVGVLPTECLAQSLAEFISELEPDFSELSIR